METQRFPGALWSCEYAHDRRAHRHRCRACNKIIDAGELVFMARASGRKTIAIHYACAGAREADGISAIERMEFIGVSHAAKCGSRLAKQWLDKNRQVLVAANA